MHTAHPTLKPIFASHKGTTGEHQGAVILLTSSVAPTATTPNILGKSLG